MRPPGLGTLPTPAALLARAERRACRHSGDVRGAAIPVIVMVAAWALGVALGVAGMLGALRLLNA